MKGRKEEAELVKIRKSKGSLEIRTGPGYLRIAKSPGFLGHTTKLG